MMKVKLKTGKVRLFIPIPYVLLTVGVTILSSKWIHKNINKWIAGAQKKEDSVAFMLPSLDKRELRGIVSELKNHRGLGLVNVKAKDGTEVIVKL